MGLADRLGAIRSVLRWVLMQRAGQSVNAGRRDAREDVDQNYLPRPAALGAGCWSFGFRYRVLGWLWSHRFVTRLYRGHIRCSGRAQAAWAWQMDRVTSTLSWFAVNWNQVGLA